MGAMVALLACSSVASLGPNLSRASPKRASRISRRRGSSKIVTTFGIRWSLILFASSLLAAAISKQVGMAVQAGQRTIREIESLLNSKPGKQLIAGMTVELRQTMKEIAVAFLWPLSRLVGRSAEIETVDYLSGDKRMVRLFCWQVYLNILHSVLAAAGLIVLATSITFA